MILCVELGIVYSMKRLFLAGIIALISTPVLGEWLEVHVDVEAGQTVYVDLDTIRHKGDLVEMWALYDYKKAQSTGRDPYMSRKVLLEFNCMMELRRMLAVTEYSDNMGSGKVIYSSNKSSPLSPKPIWVQVQPGVAETLMKSACAKK
jgi:surface-adhesin protein E